MTDYVTVTVVVSEIDSGMSLTRANEIVQWFDDTFDAAEPDLQVGRGSVKTFGISQEFQALADETLAVEVARIVRTLPEAEISLYHGLEQPDTELRVSRERWDEVLVEFVSMMKLAKLLNLEVVIGNAEGKVVEAAKAEIADGPKVLIDGRAATAAEIALLDMRVEELEFSNRIHNCLINDRIDFVGQLVQISDAVLLRMPNFGRGSLKEIKDVLAGSGWEHHHDAVRGWRPQAMGIDTPNEKGVLINGEVATKQQVNILNHKEWFGPGYGHEFIGALMMAGRTAVLREYNEAVTNMLTRGILPEDKVEGWVEPPRQNQET